jgi:hypothetical protein
MDVAVSDVHGFLSEQSEGTLLPRRFQRITTVVYLEPKKSLGSEANEF